MNGLANKPISALSNDETRVAAAYVDVAAPASNIVYSFSLAFGDFLTHIPRRLGTSDALDAAARAFTTVTASYRNGTSVCNEQALQDHVEALRALRTSLDCSATAGASQTLCAAQLIMTYEVWS